MAQSRVAAKATAPDLCLVSPQAGQSLIIGFDPGGTDRQNSCRLATPISEFILYFFAARCIVTQP
jgi:hypothetical protein